MSKRKMTGSKRNLFLAGIALLSVLLLASCTREDTLPGDGSDNLPALGLSAVQANDLSEVATRAATTSVYPTGKSIGFFVKENTANGYAACNNRKGEYNTARKLWLPVPDSIWLNNHDADIAVYAPYDATQTTAAALRLAACLRPADGSKDLWCKKFAANNKSKNLAPVLEHVYSRFVINLSLDADYKGTAPVDSVSLINDSLYAAGAFRPFETTLYKYEGDAGVGFEISPVKNLTTAAPAASIDLLLIPATLTADIKLGVTVNGITFGVKIASSRFGGKLEAGKQYNANVKLKPTELEVTSVTINDWNDVTVSGDKEPMFVPDPIDIGLSFVFAWGNLRAIKQVDNTYKYTFAEEQGYYSGVNGAYNAVTGGDYFAWNTLDPAATTGNAGAWSDALDPCRKVNGEEWYTPTAAEWNAVLEEPHTQEDAPYYMEQGGKVYGMYYGTTVSKPINQDEYMFLPASGHRKGSNWESTDEDGYYLTSTLDGAGKPQACKVDLPAGYMSYVTSVDRNDGHPIRCVKNKVIDIGLDILIATGNVRAIKRADNTYKYVFADEQGYYSGDGSGGDYFNWNTLEPMLIVTQSSWDASRDVCGRVGDGKWYTPSTDQWKTIVDAGYIRGSYQMKDGTSKNGIYFGTTKVPPSDNQEKYLFLPAAGYMSEMDGSFSYHVYWSNTLGVPYAYGLFFGNDNTRPEHSHNFFRYYRFTVRCVRNK